MARIYLDPGHGGMDPGASANGLREKDIVLKIARYARDYLREHYEGAEVRMSRTGDTYPSLSARATEANQWGADIFVSIHINSFNGRANGFESFIYNGSVRSDTVRLQDELHRQLAPLFRNDRGQKRANFAVLRLTNMPAILTENGFIDQPTDAAFLKNDSNLRKLGEAHARGIANHLRLRMKTEVRGVSVSALATSVKIQTGGLTNENLIKVIDYFRERGWYGEVVLNWENGNPRLTSGGLTPSMQEEFERWLNEQEMYYRVLP